LVIDGLLPYFGRAIRKTGTTNANAIVDFLQALKVEINASENYKKNYIVVLTKLSTFHHNKSFKEMTRDDLCCYMVGNESDKQ
jgi:site-specific recombinase XerD